MSKGLEALENIKENCDLFDEGYQWDNEFSKQFDLDIDTLEQELKRLEEFDNGVYVPIHMNRYNGLCDKEEALEIIKKISHYDVAFIDYLFDKGNITKEEYDLLKEILL